MRLCSYEGWVAVRTLQVRERSLYSMLSGQGDAYCGQHYSSDVLSVVAQCCMDAEMKVPYMCALACFAENRSTRLSSFHSHFTATVSGMFRHCSENYANQKIHAITLYPNAKCSGKHEYTKCKKSVALKTKSVPGRGISTGLRWELPMLQH